MGVLARSTDVSQRDLSCTNFLTERRWQHVTLVLQMVTKQTVNTCYRNSKPPKYHVTVVNEVNTLRITSSKWLKQHLTLQNLILVYWKGRKISLSCNRILQKNRHSLSIQQRHARRNVHFQWSLIKRVVKSLKNAASVFHLEQRITSQI